MTKRQGWLVLMFLSLIVASINPAQEYIARACFLVLGVVFLTCWFLGKD